MFAIPPTSSARSTHEVGSGEILIIFEFRNLLRHLLNNGFCQRHGLRVFIFANGFHRARLLLARLSHSRGSSGGKRSGGIHHLPLAQRRFDDQVGHVAVPLDIFRGDDNHVHRTADAHKLAVDSHRQAPTARCGFHDKQIHIAIRSAGSPGARAEKDDLLRVRHLDNSGNNLIQLALISHPVSVPASPRYFEVNSPKFKL